MAQTSCLLCGAAALKPFFGENGHNIDRCDRCGFLFVNPRPRLDEVMDYYARDYFAGTNAVEWETVNRHDFSSVLARLHELGYNAGRLLDVGCAYGAFLSQAREQGFEVMGVELSQAAAEAARSRKKLNVTTGTIADLACPAGFFDVITSFHVLEHLENPVEMLIHAGALLKSGGMLVVQVPNLTLKLARFRVIQILGAQKSDNFGFEAPTHLNFFVPATLKMLIEKSGFRVIELRNAYPYRYPTRRLFDTRLLVQYHVAGLVDLLTCHKLLVGSAMEVYALKG